MRLLKYITDLPEGRKQSFTFLLFVLFSAGIWTVNALNQIHSVETTLALKTGERISGQDPVPGEIGIELRGRGFDLIPVLTSASSCTLVRSGNEPVWDIRQSVESWIVQQGKEIDLVSVHPTAITFAVAKQHTKRLPVVPNINIRELAGWMQSGPAGIWPDSITLVSDQPIADSIRMVRTQPIGLDISTGPLFRSLALSIPAGLEASGESRIWIYVPAERATEARVRAEIRSLRKGSISVPATAEVRCRVPLSRYADTTSDRFIVAAEPDPFDPERAVLKVLHAPFWCSDIVTQPLSVKLFRTATTAS